MSALVRFGIVGAGGIAQAYASALEQSEGVALAAVADVNPGSAEGLAASSGARAFASHEDAGFLAACDAVIVATPPVTHEKVVIDLVGHGLPVLCEKPFAIDGASARRMVAAARAKGVLVSMASKFRYVDDVQRAREMVASGQIGTVK